MFEAWNERDNEMFKKQRFLEQQDSVTNDGSLNHIKAATILKSSGL